MAGSRRPLSRRPSSQLLVWQNAVRMVWGGILASLELNAVKYFQEEHNEVRRMHAERSGTQFENADILLIKIRLNSVPLAPRKPVDAQVSCLGVERCTEDGGSLARSNLPYPDA